MRPDDRAFVEELRTWVADEGAIVLLALLDRYCPHRSAIEAAIGQAAPAPVCPRHPAVQLICPACAGTRGGLRVSDRKRLSSQANGLQGAAAGSTDAHGATEAHGVMGSRGPASSLAPTAPRPRAAIHPAGRT